VTVARTGALEPTIGPALIAVTIALPTSLAAALLVDSISRRNDRRR
jgi:ABC-type phosphate transport system permease subunit